MLRDNGLKDLEAKTGTLREKNRKLAAAKKTEATRRGNLQLALAWEKWEREFSKEAEDSGSIEPPSEQPEEDTRSMTVGDELRVLTAMGIAVLYVLAFKYIGFIPASCLGLAALFFLQGKRRPLRLAILSIGTAVIVYLIFYYLMKVRFPEGLWLR